jgi:hypothetical protein
MNTAQIISAFYKGLADGGIPEPLAFEITREAARVITSDGVVYEHLEQP